MRLRITVRPRHHEYASPPRAEISGKSSFRIVALYLGAWIVLSVSWFLLGTLGLTVFMLLPWVAVVLAFCRPCDFTLLLAVRNLAEPERGPAPLTLPWPLVAVGLLMPPGIKFIGPPAQFLMPGALLGAILFLAVALVTAFRAPETKAGIIRGLAPLLLLSLVYGYVSARGLDTILDRSKETSHYAEVLAKSQGRGGEYHFTIGPWGPVRTTTKVRVSFRGYHATKVGDSACVTLHGGALGVSWYEAGLCK